MPGGAIGPNVHMMAQAGILDRYDEVLAEFPVVVKAGGAWTSVTPGSQQYWLQAFDNVLYGRWRKIDPGYGRSVLGYFGRPPAEPDPDVVRAASEQLGMPPFDGDPLESAADSLGPAEAALRERGLPLTEENLFLVAAAIVPDKDMDLNEGIRLLTGRPRVRLPLKPEAEAAPPAAPGPAPAPTTAEAAPSGPSAAWTEPVTTTCTVVENGVTRTFRVTLAPPGASGAAEADAAPVAAVPPSGPASGAAPASPAGPPAAAGGPAGAPGGGTRTPVHSPFGGEVEVVAVHVREGDRVEAGQVVAAVEAMKAQHDVRSPVAGTVASVDARPGDDVGAERPIVTIGA
jgi:pyruvate carboxylase subunit B